MSSWLAIFTRGPVAPMYGVTDAQLAVDPRALGRHPRQRQDPLDALRARHPAPDSREPPGRVPLEDQDVPLVPFPEWAPHEEAIARVCADFVKKQR